MLRPFLEWLPILGLSVGILLGADFVASAVVHRLGRRSATIAEFDRRCRRPAAVTAVLIGVQGALASSHFHPTDRRAIGHLVALGVIAAVAWVAVEASLAAESLWLRRYDIDVADNLLARKKRTQIVVLNRVTVVVICVLAGGVMLMTFTQVRALGTSLLASAGIAGLVVGAAARPTLGNIVAGVQIAFTEPIRLDDVVVVEGQWGRVEEITLTYVVLRLWDLRRLVLPISYFVDRPFENWTRSSAAIHGTAFLHLDPAADIDRVRAAYQEVLESSSRWDGRVAVLQVTDTTERTLEVRALMSAIDASTAFDLRCEVRERLMAWIRDHHPEALPRERTALVEPSAAALRQ